MCSAAIKNNQGNDRMHQGWEWVESGIHYKAIPEAAGCPPPELHPLLWPCPAPPHGILGSRGAERLGSTRDIRREGRLMGQAGKEELLGWGYPHNSVSSTSSSSVTQKWSNSHKILWGSLMCCQFLSEQRFVQDVPAQVASHRHPQLVQCSK